MPPMRVTSPVVLALSGLTCLVLASSVPACGSGDPGAGSVGTADGGGASSSSSSSSSASSASSSSGDAAPEAPFCASLGVTVTFCEDFDDGMLPTIGDVQVDPGGAVALADGVSRSRPTSARITSAPAQGGFTNALLRVPADGPASPARFTTGFAYRAEAATPAGTFVVLRVFLSATHQLTLELASADGPVLREIDAGGVDETTPLPASMMPLAGAWTRFELDVDLTAKALVLKAGAASVNATLGGTTTGLYAASFGLTTDAAASVVTHYDDLAIALR